MKPALLLTAALLFALFPNARAESPPATVFVGNEQIVIPVPEGFREVRDRTHYLWRLQEVALPPTNRLLAVFVDEVDLQRTERGESPEMVHYMVVHSNRPIESTGLSSRQFGEVASRIVREQEDLAKKISDSASSASDQLSEQYSHEFHTPVSLQLGTAKSLGLFARSANRIAFAVEMPVAVSTPAGESIVPMIGATNLLRVRSRVLYAYVYSHHRTSDDLDWVRTTSNDWSDAILAANGGTSLTDRVGAWFGSMNPIVRGGVIGGIVGATAAALAVLAKSRSKRRTMPHAQPAAAPVPPQQPDDTTSM